MQQVAQSSPCGVTAQVLAAVASVESGFGTNMATSSAGAVGYAQFLPSTWQSVNPGGDPYSFADAIPAIGRYLCSLSYGSDPTRALNAYGGCTTADCLGPGRGTYAALVEQRAASFVGATAAAASSIGIQVVALAEQWVAAHVPYAWGGASMAGVDCSGLVMEVYAQLGVQFPHNAALQFNATRSGAVDPSQAAPGDLVFFHDTDPKDPGVDHVGIVIGGGQMIDAPTDGIPVRVEPYTTAYWSGHLAGIHRVTTG